jgi:aspartate/methionine/tyrosine aminotransferase
MSPRPTPTLARVEPPPVAEVRGWVAGGTGPPLLDLSQAAPGYPPAAELSEHLAEVVRRPESARYTPILGLPELRAAHALHLSAAYGGGIGPDQVAITAGCNQAFYVAATALVGPGDEVILPAPWYFNHKMTLDLLGARAVPLLCRREAGMVPDPADAARLIGDRTRAIVLVTPNNPTGAVYPPEVIEAFFELARGRGVPLILDETYKDFLPPGQARAHELFARNDWPEGLIQLYSFSKVYAIPGYRVGSIAADAALIGAIAKIMDCLAICAPQVGQRAALFGLEHLDGWREAKRVLMAERLAAVRALFERNDLPYRIVAAGAYFAYVEHLIDGRSSTEVARRLAQDFGLLVMPGPMFGPGQEGTLRFAFANVEPDALRVIAERLAASR